MNNEIEEKLCFLSISEIGLVRKTELKKKRKKIDGNGKAERLE